MDIGKVHLPGTARRRQRCVSHGRLRVPLLAHSDFREPSAIRCGVLSVVRKRLLDNTTH